MIHLKHDLGSAGSIRQRQPDSGAAVDFRGRKCRHIDITGTDQ